MPAGPEPFLKAIAPDREDLVVCVEGLFTWYWLADLCAREGRPFVLGHALYMKAIHGGKAKNDTIDAQKIAVLLRGGMLPQAYVYPADMRATRDRLRRRIHLMRKRAEWLGPIQQTNRQYHLPDLGKKIAYKANRDGVAERCADPAVHKRSAVDLALMGHDDERLRDIERSILTAAQPHDANTLDRLRTVPGMGEILRLVLRDEIHAIRRLPRVQDFVSYCRLVTCAQDSAGKRYGTAGTKLGHASLTWAFSEAAVLCLRNNPPGQQLLVRLEKTQGKGQALTVLAHQLARAVYHRFTRARAVAMPHFLQSASGAERMSPVPNWPLSEGAWSACSVVPIARRRERCRAHRPLPLSPALCLDIRSGSAP
jgi:transposase